MIPFRSFYSRPRSLREGRTPFGMFPGVSVVDTETFIAMNESQLQEEDPRIIPLASVDAPKDTNALGLGVSAAKPTDEQLKEYLNRVFEKKTQGLKDRVMYPFLAQKLLQSATRDVISIPNVDDIKREYPDFDQTPDKTYLLSPKSDVVYDTERNITFDIESLKRLFKKRPSRILTQNSKMEKTGQGTAMVYSLGIPALKGFVVNERTNELVIASTCPGAGACIKTCYVFEGNFIRFVPKSVKMTQVLNFLLNDPEGFFEVLRAEILLARAQTRNQKKRLFIRWHDAGDFFSPEYKKKFFALATSMPDVLFYAYTKIASVVTSPDKPENVTLSFSTNAISREVKQIDPTQYKTAITIPRELFADLTTRVPIVNVANTDGSSTKLVWKSPDHLATFIDRLAKTYDVDPDTIITNDELLSIPFNSGERHQYNVIVMPGESDDAAARNDVLRTFLLLHGKTGVRRAKKTQDPVIPITPRSLGNRKK